MKCARCDSENYIKNGIVLDRQRYCCLACNYNYTTNIKRGYPTEIKRKAIDLAIAGYNHRAIGRLLSVSNVTVAKWVRQHSNADYPSYVPQLT
ncbi:IS1 family transposase [Hymenobacter metallicola]|uniref:IS1 family transposase n=1 Tax=Hymenobacter metallicola TaxID=2563114 RepID=A0A4Z0QBF8_9BACT|nr:IS1 family transposase [Hymenobacter metallicola]TGE27417.1 IS1 family transposase [Hymenobacter metallicola]